MLKFGSELQGDICAILRLFRAKLGFGLNAFATDVRQTAPTQQQNLIVLVG